MCVILLCLVANTKCSIISKLLGVIVHVYVAKHVGYYSLVSNGLVLEYKGKRL